MAFELGSSGWQHGRLEGRVERGTRGLQAVAARQLLLPASCYCAHALP